MSAFPNYRIRASRRVAAALGLLLASASARADSVIVGSWNSSTYYGGYAYINGNNTNSLNVGASAHAIYGAGGNSNYIYPAGAMMSFGGAVNGGDAFSRIAVNARLTDVSSLTDYFTDNVYAYVQTSSTPLYPLFTPVTFGALNGQALSAYASAFEPYPFANDFIDENIRVADAAEVTASNFSPSWTQLAGPLDPTSKIDFQVGVASLDLERAMEDFGGGVTAASPFEDVVHVIPHLTLNGQEVGSTVWGRAWFGGDATYNKALSAANTNADFQIDLSKFNLPSGSNATFTVDYKIYHDAYDAQGNYRDSETLGDYSYSQTVKVNAAADPSIDPSAVPLPSTAAAGMSLLGALAVVAARGRRRHASEPLA